MMRGPHSSDGIPIRSGAKVQLRIRQTSGEVQTFPKVQFGVAQLEPEGTGALLLPPPIVPALGPPMVIGSWIALGHSQATSGPTVRVQQDESTVNIADDISVGGREVIWSLDGTRVFVGSDIDPYLYVIDVASGELETGWPAMPAARNGLSLSPDGKRLFLVGDGGLSDRQQVIDVETKTIEDGWTETNRGSLAVAWSPVGDLVAVGGTTSGTGVRFAMFIVETKTVESVTWPQPENGQIGSVVFSPTGEQYAIGVSSSPPVLMVVDVASREEITGWPQPLSGSASPAVAYSPDGTMLAVANQGGLYIVDVASKTVIEDGRIATVTGSNGISWSADGSRIAVVGVDAGTDTKVVNVASRSVEAGWPTVGQLSVAFAYSAGSSWSG